MKGFDKIKSWVLKCCEAGMVEEEQDGIPHHGSACAPFSKPECSPDTVWSTTNGGIGKPNNTVGCTDGKDSQEFHGEAKRDERSGFW